MSVIFSLFFNNKFIVIHLLQITAPTIRTLLSRGMPLTHPSPLKIMGNLHSRGMVNRIMARMPNLLLVIVVTPRPHLQLEDIPSSNNSMDLLMPSRHQLAILLPSLLLTATPSQPRVMEPVGMRVLQLLLLQQLLSLMALNQAILPSLPTLVMVSRLLLLHLRVTMQTASQPATTKTAIPSQQRMGSNSLDTRPSRAAMASSRATSSRPSSSRLLLLTHLRLLVPMGSLHPTSTASKEDRPVTTRITITTTIGRMARVVVPVTLVRSLQGTPGQEKEGVEMALIEVE